MKMEQNNNVLMWSKLDWTTFVTEWTMQFIPGSSEEKNSTVSGKRKKFLQRKVAHNFFLLTKENCELAEKLNVLSEDTDKIIDCCLELCSDINVKLKSKIYKSKVLTYFYDLKYMFIKNLVLNTDRLAGIGIEYRSADSKEFFTMRFRSKSDDKIYAYHQDYYKYIENHFGEDSIRTMRENMTMYTHPDTEDEKNLSVEDALYALKLLALFEILIYSSVSPKILSVFNKTMRIAPNWIRNNNVFGNVDSKTEKSDEDVDAAVYKKLGKQFVDLYCTNLPMEYPLRHRNEKSTYVDNLIKLCSECLTAAKYPAEDIEEFMYMYDYDGMIGAFQDYCLSECFNISNHIFNMQFTTSHMKNLFYELKTCLVVAIRSSIPNKIINEQLLVRENGEQFVQYSFKLRNDDVIRMNIPFRNVKNLYRGTVHKNRLGMPEIYDATPTETESHYISNDMSMRDFAIWILNTIVLLHNDRYLPNVAGLIKIPSL